MIQRVFLHRTIFKSISSKALSKPSVNQGKQMHASMCLVPKYWNTVPIIFCAYLFVGLGTTERTSFQPPTPEKSGSFSSSVSDRANIPQFVALGELEFRKAFLILSYIGGYTISCSCIYNLLLF